MEQIDLQKYIPGAISLGLLILAYLSYQRNAKQKLREKQQETIADLIRELRGNQIEFLFGEVSKSGFSGMNNFWTLLYIGKQDSNTLRADFDDIELSFHHKSNQLVGIESFVKNSYTPPRIREILENFNPRSYDNVNSTTITDYDPLVSLTTNYFVERPPFELERGQNSNQLKFPQGAVAFESWLSFKISCVNLVKEINQHLDKINASDLKI